MLQQTNSGHEPDTAALVSMASVVPVVNTAAPRSTVDAFIARIETLLKTVVATIQDQKLSGKAVAAIVTQIEDIVASDQEAASNISCASLLATFINSCCLTSTMPVPLHWLHLQQPAGVCLSLCATYSCRVLT